MPDEKKKNPDETTAANDVAPAENGSSSPQKSDLAEPIWSIVTFNGLEQSGLTYDQAVARMAILATEQVAGLCIVTDAAASNLDKTDGK